MERPDTKDFALCSRPTLHMHHPWALPLRMFIPGGVRLIAHFQKQASICTQLQMDWLIRGLTVLCSHAPNKLCHPQSLILILHPEKGCDYL